MNEQSPDKIQREIEKDRARIDQTLDALGNRLSPGQLVDQVLGYVRQEGGDISGNLVRSFKQNPYPAILTAFSLTWLVQSTRQDAVRSAGQSQDGRDDGEAESRAAERARAMAARVQRKENETEEQFRARVTEAKAKALDVKQRGEESADAFKQRVDSRLEELEQTAARLREQAHEKRRQMSEAAREHGQRAQEGARNAGDRLQRFYETEPLVAGVLALAAGTLIAGLPAPTRAENKHVGPYGDKLRDAVHGAAREAAAEGGHAAADGAEDGLQRGTGSDAGTGSGYGSGPSGGGQQRRQQDTAHAGRSQES